MPIGRRRFPNALLVVLVLMIAVLAVGCGAEQSPLDDPSPSSGPSTSASSPPSPSSALTHPAVEATTEESRAPQQRGIDVSHHQGRIDWQRVAEDDIAFAYLKASEGSTFTDPRFVSNWAAASGAGLRVGGYHYYSLCSDPRGQAEHFVTVLDAAPPARRGLPPVVDLELLGNCDPSPPTNDLRARVNSFIDLVEDATGERLVVYTHPDFDARYSWVSSLDRRRWVRRTDGTRPVGDWWLWQRSDDALVAGVTGPVDLDVLR